MGQPRSRLLARSIRRHLTRHPWHLGLSILGVALGVAVMVAMDLAIQSSREALRVSMETVAGRATHHVLGGAPGLSDSLPARIRIDGGIREAAPVVEGFVTSPLLPGRPLRMLGVDPLSEAPFRPWLDGGPGAEVDGLGLMTRRGAVLLSRETAEAAGVEEGDAFAVEAGGITDSMFVAGVLEPGTRSARVGLRDLLVADIAEAQDRLGRTGRLDRVDLIVPPGSAGDAAIQELKALLPAHARIEATGTREAALQEMIRAFDLNLTALSLLALLFGVFLIYNTMTFSVVRRRRTLGTLRALGVSRGQVVRGVLAEAAVLGIAGSLVGVAAGVILGRGLVTLVTRTINDLYFVVAVEGLTLPPEVLLKGGVLGVGATLLAALPPVWEAASVTPRDAMIRSAVEDTARRSVPRAAGLGVGLGAVGAGLLVLPDTALFTAFAGLFCVIVGMALLTPAVTVLLMRVLRAPARSVAGILGAMAARGVVTSLSRTAPAMVALVIAVSVTVGLGVMIQSFRGSVAQWLDVTLQADLYVSPPEVISARVDGRLPGGLADSVRMLPGVAGVSTYRGVEVETQEGPVRLVALDLDPRGESGIDLIQTLRGREDALDRFREGAGVLLSEPLAFRRGLEAGDSLEVMGAAGRDRLEWIVLGIYRDYGSERGAVMLSRRTYDRIWDDPAISSLGVFLEPDVDGEAVAEAIRGLSAADTVRRLAAADTVRGVVAADTVRQVAVGGHDGAIAASVLVRSNRDLRDASLEVFDRTFAITRVLRLLAFGVAFIAVLSALMALQLERGREMGVLRANGMSPWQMWSLITSQTGLMGLVAGILAVPAGLVLAVVMIFVINRRSFGWTLDMIVSPGILLQAAGLALIGALLAGIYPSWRMARISPAAALREE